MERDKGCKFLQAFCENEIKRSDYHYGLQNPYVGGFIENEIQRRYSAVANRFEIFGCCC